ncbi:helix-turn-helix transcriptional regulator [bacterium]|nr:MAG: helix-turn-helix transcriptional regulator [bacterium]
MSLPSTHNGQPLVGREGARKALLDALERVSRERVAQTISLVGVSGQGKTALLAQLASDAAERGRTIFEAAAHESQSSVPLATARRLLHRIVDQVGIEPMRRYASGLEQALFARDLVLAERFGVEQIAAEADIFRFQRSFVALLEGMLVDLPVVIVVDDIQWIDGESLRTLQLAAADLAVYPLLIVLARRPSAEHEQQAPVPQDIALENLERDAARSLVTQVYPDAGDAVIGSIVECSQGLPYALVSLASEARAQHVNGVDGLRESVRAVVSDQMKRLDPDVRTYLEILSLMEQPLSFKAAAVMAQSSEVAMNHLAHLVGSFLVAEEGSFRFSHALVCDAVRSIVRFPEGLHQKIVRALLGQPHADEQFAERIVYHARACGEEDVEYEYLLKIARAAIASSAWHTAEACFSRALEVRKPPIEEHAAFYNQYGMALRALNRPPELQFSILDQAIKEGRRLGIKSGFGPLAMALVWTVVMYFHDRERARHIYESLLRSMEDERDRWDIRSIWAYISADRVDTEVVDALNALRVAESLELSDAAVTNFALADLMMDQRLLGHQEALEALNVARVRADSRNTHLGIGCMMHEFLLKLYEFGVTGARELVPDRLRVARVQWARTGFLRMLYWSLSLEIACGNFGAVLEALSAVELATAPDTSRGEMCALAAMIAGFTDRGTVFDAEVNREVERAMRLPDPSVRDFLVVAWAAGEVARDSREAARRIDAVRSTLTKPASWWLPSCPALAVLYAQRAGDVRLLEMLAQGETIEERSPWHRAHNLLMTGWASETLRVGSGKLRLEEAAGVFARLGATFYAAYAHSIVGAENAVERAMLRDLDIRPPARVVGGKKKPTKRREAKEGLTFREQEIAGLVAEGKTNREIAVALFLSERTVEAHLASIFRKLNVTSRVQVARWQISAGLNAWAATRS